MGPRGRFYSYMYHVIDVGQVLYLGRVPRTKETLPDFRERCRVTRHSRVFARVDVVNGPSGFGASQLGIRA